MFTALYLNLKTFIVQTLQYSTGLLPCMILKSNALCMAGFHTFGKHNRSQSYNNEGESVREVHPACNSGRS